MDCNTIHSANELPRHADDKATTSSNDNNVLLVKDDVVVEEVNNNNPTTSSTNVTEQKVQEAEDGEKCLHNINFNDQIDEQDETKTPYSPTMMTMIVKGKRTKRQRIHSPNLCTNNQEDNNIQVMTNDDDEEMDMANCLILLAQGPSRPPLIRRNELGLFTSSRGSTMRFASDNKRPSYNNNSSVYECKTCNRTFPSFQALGGHRASHKKLKITTNAISDNYDHSFSQMVTVATSSSPSPLSLQLGNVNYTRSATPATPTPRTNFVAQNNKNRVHECAICGAEFSSGQALGGHMRRHRGPIMPLNSSTTTTTTNTTNKLHAFANTTLSLSTVANNEVAVAAVESKVNRINDGFLSLDLNLPASPSPLAPIVPPTEQDENKLSKGQPQTTASSSMVLSTPALVDCFY